MSEKKPPNLPAQIEADLTRDLKKVGGFFKGLWSFTDKAERAIQEATREDEPRELPTREEMRGVEKRMEARSKQAPKVIDVRETKECEVCGGARVVGGTRKIPCPECT